MTPVEAICVPAFDMTFAERVRGLIRNEHWDLESPEGIALMQALLRGSYPSAIVMPRVTAGGDVPAAAPLVLVVVRDGGRTEAEIAPAWLALVRARNYADLYDVASGMLADPRDVADVVEEAFLTVAATTSPSVDAESVGLALRMAVVQLALVAADRRSTTQRVTPSQALEQWRVAERRLALAAADELDAARSEVDRARTAYHRSIGRPHR